MLHNILSWWKSSPAVPTTMSKNGSDEVSNPARFEVREPGGRREISGDDGSGGKDLTMDSQGLSQSGKPGEEYRLDKTAPSMGVTKLENSPPRGRHASDPSNARDPELVTSARRGAGHLQQDRKRSAGRKPKELEYTRTEKQEVQNTENTGLLAAHAEADDLREKLKESERQMICLSKVPDDERREKKNFKTTKEVGLTQGEVHTLRQKLDQTEKESSRKSRSLDTMKKETETLKNDIGKGRRHIEDLRNELEATHRRINEYAIHCERQNQELQAVREQLQRAEVGHQQTRERLTERTAELKNAQLFIDVADSLSGADIISMTAALNAEILHSAALMADSLDYTEKQGKAPNEVLFKVQEKIGEILTQALIDQRFVDGENVDPTPVQLALQVCLVRCSKAIITSWTLGGNDDRLSAIYSRIWNKEKQSVAGRWRSMTQMHATAADGSDLALQMIIREVERILIATRTNYHLLADQFHERLSTINNLSLHLRSSIGQYITSMEIRPFTIEPGIAFDPSEMEDTYAEKRRSNSMAVEVVGGRVAGSTELGLISGVKDISGKVKTKVMLKPKVVLCSALT